MAICTEPKCTRQAMHNKRITLPCGDHIQEIPYCCLHIKEDKK